jgi:hypothetical protein
VLTQFGGAQFSAFKPALSDLLVAKLSPITAEMRRLKDDTAYIDSVLADGSARAPGARRRNHEGGQGHRRLRAAIEASNASEPEKSGTTAPCAAAKRRGTIAPLSRGLCEHVDDAAAPSYEAGHKPKWLVVIDDTRNATARCISPPARRARRRRRDHAARDRDP